MEECHGPDNSVGSFSGTQTCPASSSLLRLTRVDFPPISGRQGRMADGNMTLRPGDSRLPDDGARRWLVDPLAGALLYGVCPGPVRALAVFAGMLLFADDGLPSTVAVPGAYP